MDANETKKLTKTELLFIDAYFDCNFNATKAYRSLHPDVKHCTCQKEGYRFMARPQVRKAVNDRIKAGYDALSLTAETIATRLLNIVDDPETTNKDKISALGLLQKQLGLQTQNVKAEVDNVVEINVKINKDE